MLIANWHRKLPRWPHLRNKILNYREINDMKLIPREATDSIENERTPIPRNESLNSRSIYT